MFFVLAALGDLISGTETSKGVLIGIAVLFATTFFSGIFLIKRNIFKDKEIQNNEMEKNILKVVKAKEGIVTVAEIAAETNLDLENSKKFLDNFCDRGFASVSVTESGSIVYGFKGFLTKDEKDKVKNDFI